MMFIKRFPSFLTSLISLLGAILFLGAAACQPSKQSERITEQKSEQLGTQGLAKTSKPVEVAVAKTDEIRSELNLSGTIMPNAKVSIFSKMAGQIVKMPVEVGQQVNKGDLLAVIEHEELLLNKRQAQAAYRSAEAAYNQVQKLARIQIEGQVAQAQASVSAAETSLQQVKENLKSNRLNLVWLHSKQTWKRSSVVLGLKTVNKLKRLLTKLKLVYQTQKAILNVCNNCSKMVLLVFSLSRVHRRNLIFLKHNTRWHLSSKS